jgi:hypothetical protein
MTGFSAVFHFRVLGYLAMFFAVVESLHAQLGVSLAFLVKHGADLTTSDLGNANAALAVGGILGALAVGPLRRLLKQTAIVRFALIFIALGYLWLSTVSQAAMFATLAVGCGMAALAVVIQSQLAIAIPAQLQSRVFAILGFVEQIMSPVAVFCAGYLLDFVGAAWAFVASAVALILLAVALPAIPRLLALLDADHSEAATFLSSTYGPVDQAS